MLNVMPKTPREYYHQNREAYLAANRRYRAKHKEMVAAKKAAWFQRKKHDPEFIEQNRLRYRRWAANNREDYSRRKAIETIRRKYKVTRDAAAQLWQQRKQGCEVCGSTFRVGVDHCHKTGAIRGVLCLNCNSALGRVHDNPEILQRLILYINRPAICLPYK